jgi:hypothetical protein
LIGGALNSILEEINCKNKAAEKLETTETVSDE